MKQSKMLYNGLMFALTQAFSKLQLAQASEQERPAKKEQRRRRR